MDEMDAPGQPGLDIHLNAVPKGRVLSTYPGEQASEGRLRITPEFSWGLTPNIELGAYLPLATVDRDGRLAAAGVKGRIKFLAPRPADQPWFWGLNFELGRVNHALDINPWNAELKGIAGVRKGPWTVATNLNIDWVVSGPERSPTSFELATKVSYQLRPGLAAGLENYSDLGSARHFGRLADGDQRVFLVMDKTLGRWDLDLGLGHGYGRPEDRWIVRAIIGVPIGN